jgi:hypothetical protein
VFTLTVAEVVAAALALAALLVAWVAMRVPAMVAVIADAASVVAARLLL